VYGSLMVTAADGADVTLEIDKTALAADAAEATVAKVALLRRHAMAAPFLRGITAVASGQGAAATTTTVHFRGHEPTYILPRADRLAVIYTLEFEDDTERALARIIAQEFVECQRHVGNAPAVNFNDLSPPLELKGMSVPQTPAFVGYLTLSLNPRHWDSPAKKEAVLNQMVMFRSYLDYHIKAAKANLHARMRTRVDNWLQVLNRATPEDPFASKEKKNILGRTFVRKS
jgi:actin related protein 2/3 complex subunit 2